jgi:hypothetical protein
VPVEAEFEVESQRLWGDHLMGWDRDNLVLIGKESVEKLGKQLGQLLKATPAKRPPKAATKKVVPAKRPPKATTKKAAPAKRPPKATTKKAAPAKGPT